jgi:predicted O-methyltransferase YrrM
MVLDHVEGDILEIGAHQGRTTKIFCDLGKQYNRHVFVVDPWDGRQQGNQKTFEAFQGATRGCDNLTVQHLGSEDPRVLGTFQKDDVKFAYILIDGLHSYDAVKNDLERYKDLLQPGGIICIDDWRGPYGFSVAIRKAATDHLDEHYQELPTPDSFIENYFVKLS